MAITITGKVTQSGKSLFSPAMISGGMDRAVMSGGFLDINTLDYVTISSLGNATSFGENGHYGHTEAGASNGTSGRGLFGGRSISSTRTNYIDYVTISTPSAPVSFGQLTEELSQRAAGSNGTNDRGVFAGGATGDGQTVRSVTMDWVTISSEGNSTDFGDLGVGRDQVTAASNGTSERAAIAGGRHGTDGASRTHQIEYITISTPSGASAMGFLSGARRQHGAASNDTNDRGIWAGGISGGSVRITVIDYKIISSEAGTATVFGNLATAMSWPAGASNGVDDRAIFSGGASANNVFVNTIVYVTITSEGNSIPFGELVAERTTLAAVSDTAG